MLYICFGFDYELFLGENYVGYDEILFHPTAQIADIFSKNNLSATFFADVLSSIQLKKFQETRSYSEGFENQIRQLTKQNMDVQLHIHSNWLMSKVNDGRLCVSPEKYKIHDFDFSENGQAKSIIEYSINYLNQLCRLENSRYKCIAYRAGGFMIQPEEKLFTTLSKNGIVIDSSIAPFMKNGSKSSGYFYDFSKCPRNTTNWYINPYKGLEYKSETKNDCLFEVPIFTYRFNPFKALLVKKDRIRLKPIKHQGSYVSLKNQSYNLFSKLIKKLFGRRLISLDTDQANFIYKQLLYFYKIHKCEKRDVYISIIGHPKLICNQERLKNIDTLLKLITNCNKKIKVISFNEIYLKNV